MSYLPEAMSAERAPSLGKVDVLSVLGAVLSFLTVSIVVYYSYMYRQLPDTGFILDSETGVVVHVSQPCEDGASCLQQGDQIIKIGDITFERYRNDRTVAIYQQFDTGEAIPVEFRRGNELTVIHLTAVTSTRGGLSSLSAVFFPAVFWVMGTVAVIFLRPRDLRWLLLVLFQYDTALWVSAGLLAFSQLAYSAVVYSFCLWLFLPLSVHLHLILPDAPFKRLHGWLLAPLYLATVVLIVLDHLHLIPRAARLGWALMAMVISLGLLVLRRFVATSPATKVANRVMLYGVSLGLGPIIVLVIFYLIDLAGLLASNYITFVVSFSLIIFPIWPLTYIYAIYKHDLGTFELRANRVLGGYGFFVIYATVYTMAFNAMVAWWVARGLEVAFFGLMLSMVFVAGAPLLYLRFQRLVDQRLFGIKYRPSEVIGVFAERIPTAYNREILRRVIVSEILPTLLIRQSGLYVFGEDGIETIYQQDVPRQDVPVDAAGLMELAGKAGRFISFSMDRERRHGWVRLVVPLSIPEKTIGIWLLGRRDPDDYYTKSDIALLGNLANQIAPVIENFRLVEQARRLVERAQQEVEENRKLQEQLVHAQKMEAIGRLSAGVAHDFNNILSVIIGYSNLLLAQYGHEQSLQQFVTNIKDAGERAAALTKQLLAFSRQQVMEAKVTSVNQIVSDVEKMLRRLAGEDIELVTDLRGGLPRVKIDPGQMGQVIINLAVNARDAMPRGGRITIETRTAECGGGSPCEGIPPGTYVLLRVSDVGSGIDPKVQRRIFEPYFTTKEMGKGTGLGLSMVYGIINQSKGYILVDSEVGGGTTFSIYLPAVVGAMAEEEEVAGARPGFRHAGNETILLVEDEQSVRAVTSEILQSNGYTVIESRDGVEALRDFERHGSTIDLLLTDVVMPRMRGPELADRLLDLQPELMVIYMSGYHEEAYLGQGVGGEGATLIQKPFSPESLARRIREALDSKETRAPQKMRA